MVVGPVVHGSRERVCREPGQDDGRDDRRRAERDIDRAERGSERPSARDEEHDECGDPQEVERPARPGAVITHGLEPSFRTPRPRRPSSTPPDHLATASDGSDSFRRLLGSFGKAERPAG